MIVKERRKKFKRKNLPQDEAKREARS